MTGVREANRAKTTAEILRIARREIAEHGGGGLSMRAVAREVGMVSSAVYRYFPTREALLTAMIIESYGNLAAALGEVRAKRPDHRWRDLAHAMRDWARANPNEFQLIYGTPIPGYVAPPETVPSAAAAVRPFLEVGAKRAVEPFGGRDLTAQMSVMNDAAPGSDPSGSAAVIAELGAFVGLLTLELAGHLVGSADPADHLWNALLTRQLTTLNLA
ncbi:TetR/AcrR family transcriptional regulator [Pseudactinotalea sp.]|uniref:TetR/AcrR family transcriptional regulator n=1 Tax=Pseudactinotalea sp. TaxID=1926260 RepID=UPI003B3AE057